MRNGSSEPDPAASAGLTDGEATQTVHGRGQAGQFPADNRASPPVPTATAPPPAAAGVVRHGPGITAPASASHASRAGGQAGQPPEVVRYGPGVPAAPQAGQVGLTAEHVWRASGRGQPPRSRSRLGRVIGALITTALLAVSGVLLYLRFHHAPFHVTGVAITQQVHNGCAVDVTGQLSTNGSAGTVSYQWLVEPSRQPPQPLSQPVPAGQQAVYVTVAVNGTGHGSASQTVVLQVLGPDTRTASAQVTVSC